MSKTADAASALTEAFFRSVPSNQKKRMSETEWASALQKFHREAHAIRTQFALGLLARALVANQFQKRLLASGFDADIVRKVVFSLVLNVFISKQ